MALPSLKGVGLTRTRPQNGKSISDAQIRAFHAEGIPTIGPPRPGQVLPPPISPAETVRLQQRAAEEVGLTPGIRLHIPFIKKPFLRPATGAEQLFKFIIETPERVMGSLREAQTIITTGKRPEERARVETHFDEMESFKQAAINAGYSEGVSTTLSVLYAGGSAILDIADLGFLLRGGVKAILKNVAVPDESYQFAYNTLGKPETLADAERTRKQLLRDIHPDNPDFRPLPGENLQKVREDIDNAIKILRKEGIKLVPSKVTSTIRDLARAADMPVEDLARGVQPEIKVPFARPAGLLPGTRPKGGRLQPRLGLAIEEVEDVGRPRRIPDDLQPLAEEARKFKTAEEFVEARPTIYRGDTVPIKLSEMDTTKVFNPAEKEALSAFDNTPGLYFTDSISNAKSYGKNLTSVSIEPTAKVINVNDARKVLKRADVEKIIRSNPRIKDWATNWSENFDEAIKNITDSVMAEKDGNEFLKAIWSDGGFAEADFVNAMKKAGIDGITVPKEGVNHFVIYNKDILKTKSQLTDLFNQVKGEVPTKRPPTPRELGVAPEPAPFVRKRETTLLKERIRNLARGAREGAFSTKKEILQAQSELTSIIRASGLEAKDQAKFLEAVKNIQSQEQLIKEIPNIEQRISKLLEAEDVRTLRARIDKQLKDIAPKRDPSGVLKSKFTPEQQEKLNKIKELASLPQKVAEERLLDLLEVTLKAEDFTPELADRVRLLSYSSRELNSAQLQALLDDIVSIKETGKTISETRKLNKETEIQRQVDNIVPAIQGDFDVGKGIFPSQNPTYDNVFLGRIRKGLDDYVNSIMSYEFLMDKLTQAKQYEVLKGPAVEHATQYRRQIAKQESGEALAFHALNEGIVNAWGVTNPSDAYKNLFGIKKIGTFTDAFGKKVVLEMTADEAIALRNWMQDPTLEATFRDTMGFTSEMTSAIKKSLSPEEVRYADFLINEFYPKYFNGYDGVSLREIYLRRFDTDFTPRTNYTPLARELDKPVYLEQLSDHIQQLSTKPGQIKARTNNKFPIKVRGATDIAVKYTVDMERFKHLSEYIDTSRKMFNHPDFKEAVKASQKDGQRYLDLLDDTLEAIWRGQRKFEDRVGWVDTLKSYGASGMLGLNPTQIPKQLTSIVASMSRVPLGEWSLGFANFFKNPVKNFGILQESSLLKARYKRANFNQELAQARKDGFIEKMSGKTPFREKLLFMTRYGDLGGIVGAGWPVYRYEFNQALKRGLSREEAHKRALAAFEDNFSQTQTSARMGDVGKIQRGNSWGSMWTLFMNSLIQYNRFALAAFRNILKGKGTKRQNAKIFFIFWSLLPTLFGLAAHPQDIVNVFQDSEKGSRARRRMAVNMLAGGTQYQIIVGSALYNLARSAGGLPAFFWNTTTPTPFTVIDEIGREGEKLIDEIKDVAIEGDISAEEVWEAMQEFDKIATLLTGVPVENTAKLAKNYWEVFSGEEENYLKLFGYSDWALDADLRRAPTRIKGLPSLKGAGVGAGSLQLPSLKGIGL